MNLYDLKENMTVARQNGFVFNPIYKLLIKIFSHQRYLNIGYSLKYQIPMCQRQSSRVISQNREIVETLCNDLHTPFHFACRKWFNKVNWKLHIIL